jgi:hypothetical protein
LYRFGQILTLLAGLSGLAFIRNWIFSKWPKVRELHLDIILGALLIGGVVVSEIIHNQESREAAQQKQILEARTKLRVEYFNYNQKDRMMCGKDINGHIVVFFNLAEVPIRESIRLQQYISIQPPDSYIPFNNILIFSWGGSKESLQEKEFSITYVADPEMKGIKSMLRVSNDKFFIDEIHATLNGMQIMVAE